MLKQFIFYTYFNDEDDTSSDSPLNRSPTSIIVDFRSALRKFGIESKSIREYEPVENAIVWGAYKEGIFVGSSCRKDLSNEQRKRDLNTIVVERGYIERQDYYAIGFTNYPRELNNESDFKNKGMPNDRAKQLNVSLEPWKEPDEKRKCVLVCGQTFDDANVDGVDYGEWLTKTLLVLLKTSDKKIIYRDHPLEKRHNIRIPKGVKLSADRSIEQDLEIAASVVSYNSNSCVEAVIKGIPAFTFSERSVAWDVTNHSLSDINNPRKFDRQQWLNDLAYAQWNLKEIEQGLPFKHLGII
jgi:hypothetical protein